MNALHPLRSPLPSRRRSLAWLAGLGAAPALLLAPQRARAEPAGLDVLHTFAGGREGAYPASLLVHSDGTLYGIAESGGRRNRGLIFRISARGYRVVHDFISGEGSGGGLGGDRLDPLVEGPDGALYGTTFDGGNFGKGLAYRLNDLGQLVQLHHFTGGELDGMSPNEQLSVGLDGAFYGTGVRVVGGWNQVPQAYRMDAEGNVTHLAQIGSGLNGLGKLTLASDGQFYTMSMSGGTFGDGGAYRVAPTGGGTPIYSVDAVLPRLSPSGGFVQHPNGFLYGTTENDPEDQRLGTVFRMSLDGQVKILHRFTGDDGMNPFGLLLGRDGRLYGVARSGGPQGFGAIYAIDTRGRFSVVHAFEDFCSPVGRLAQGRDGRLYGVTQFGPLGSFGAVYAVRPS
jgi:uncharacterized repeat protein (TIGR03803 family)